MNEMSRLFKSLLVPFGMFWLFQEVFVIMPPPQQPPPLLKGTEKHLPAIMRRQSRESETTHKVSGAEAMDSACMRVCG